VLTGTVAAGGAVAGALVQARCASGELQTRSDANGAFGFDLATVALPCLLRASGGTRGGAAVPPLHGVALEPGNAPIHPLSELVLARAAGALPADAYLAGQVPAASALVAATRYVADQVEALPLARPQGDLWRGAFAPGDANDLLLEALARLIAHNGVSLEGLVQTAARAGDLRAYVAAERLVEIEFVARAGDAAVACGDTLIPRLGSGAVSARLMDLRFYLSNVALLRADGTAVPLRLPPNDAWNHTAANGDSVTLIDLENGTADCAAEGTAGTNAWLRGSVPAGRYVGLRMTLGVPPSLNHSDTAAAPPPLDLFAMGWGWQAGRKFAKIEVTEPSPRAWRASTFFVHLGSTGCTGNPGLGQVSCTRSNRGTVQFDDFDASRQKIVVDVQVLLAGTDVTRNQGGAFGCMSAATDADCLKVFEALAIEWRADGSGSGEVVGDGRAQTVFRAVDR
jgi:uncharacterized repeat protein (TIGR04052 family)